MIKVEKKEFTVLITDDEKHNLDILGQILSPLYNLLVAKTGSRCIELAEEHRPDLILLDVLMPDITGFETIEALKASEITRSIPVIFITGLSGVKDEEKGFSLGAVDYIAKPFSKSIVKARVSTHLKIVSQMRTIESIGMIDPLTEISNRRGFDNRLLAEWGRAIREQTSISVLMLDVDHFKNYNDTYGHQQGDQALKLVASVCHDAVMRPFDIAARWGGEEFIVLLPCTDDKGAEMVAEKIRKTIEASVITTEDGQETGITASIGLYSVIPQVGSDTSEFINKADRALYKAKESGRNRVVIFGE
ncbi:MAG: diguanylate cyclase [Oscillospiraceae bacterium]|nr:diguanylate cyclase [Oscillospiraceae bacterium]